MRLAASTSSDGVTEQFFTLDGVPGVLWTPANARGVRPLILLGHGGGQHKTAPGIVARARRFAADGGFAAVAIDAPHHGDRPKTEEFVRITTELRARVSAGEDAVDAVDAVDAMHRLLAGQAVPEWTRVLTAVQELDHVGAGPVGYFGLSMGCGLGVPFLAAEPRVRAAVLGLFASPTLAGAAAGISVPVRFLVQWDDEMVPRAHSLALFDALASTEKTLHANPGRHRDVPSFETDSALRFFARHLR
jgi:dienelactone hydrolase